MAGRGVGPRTARAPGMESPTQALEVLGATSLASPYVRTPQAS
jgi:hypothetical protein